MGGGARNASKDKLLLSDNPKIIDHIPNERRPGNGIWWLGWAMVALLWVWYLYFHEFDWPAVAIGAISGLMLASWAIDITGNKVPEWLLRIYRR